MLLRPGRTGFILAEVVHARPVKSLAPVLNPSPAEGRFISDVPRVDPSRVEFPPFSVQRPVMSEPGTGTSGGTTPSATYSIDSTISTPEELPIRLAPAETMFRASSKELMPPEALIRVSASVASSIVSTSTGSAGPS